MNVADSEVVASVMKTAGYDTVKDIESADAVESADIFLSVVVVSKPPFQEAAKFGKLVFEIIFPAGQHRHRDGVQKLWRKLLLVDIQADSDDACRQGVSAKGVLNEYSAYFPVPDIDVVRPFDRGHNPFIFTVIKHAQGDAPAYRELP